MLRLAQAIVVYVSAYLSILGFYFIFWPLAADRPAWHTLAIFGGSIAYALMFWAEAKRLYSEPHRSLSDKRIKKYMAKWVARPGRTVILSRDLSWGADFTSKQSLLQKSKVGDLILFLQSPTPLSNELQQAGATVHCYGNQFEPRSRFTVIGFGKEGSRVAIGTRREGKQIVYEYDMGEHPIAALSDDMVRLMRTVSNHA